MEVNSLQEASWGLKVTDRGLADYEKLTRFNHDILPQKAKILNIGGGLTQVFEKELKEARPDVSIITLDPSLFENNYDVQTHEGVKGIWRNRPDEKRADLISNKEGTVVGLGQAIPLADETIDEAIDIHAAAQYSNSEESYKQYLREVMRVLKPGGKFYIFNTYMGDPVPGDEENERQQIEFSQRIFAELGIEAEVYAQTERMVEREGKMQPDRRVCAVIIK